MVGTGFRLVRIASPHPHLAEASLQGQHFHLMSRLGAGADHCHRSNFLARQVFGGDGACGSGAEVGDESVIEEESRWGSGFGVKNNDHAVVRRQTELWIARKSRDDFYRVVRTVMQVSGFDVNLAALLRQIIFRNIQMNDRRQLRPPGGVRCKSLFHRGNTSLGIEPSADLVLAQNQDFTTHPQSLSSSSSKHYRF